MEASWKGDVYKAVTSVAFQAVARNIKFEDWAAKQDVLYWLGDEVVELGYYLIIVDSIQEGSMSAPVIDGVFVPRHLDKMRIAEDMRRRFGSSTVLLKEDDPDVCDRARRLSSTISHGNDLDNESSTWLNEHTHFCPKCRLLPIKP